MCDVINCYAINNSFTIRETTTAPDNKAVCGGLVGRAGHAVDNSRIMNSFSYGNTFDNKKSPDYVGGITGSIVHWLNTANLSYDAEKAYALDDLEQEYPTMTKVTADDFKAADAVEALKLNDGNSKTVWIASPADGHPVIELTALLENENTTVAWDPLNEETTAEEVEATTAGEGETTTAEEVEQTTAGEVEQTTAAQGETTTKAAGETTTSAPAPAKKGCGSAVSLIVPVMILGAAIVVKSKKD